MKGNLFKRKDIADCLFFQPYIWAVLGNTPMCIGNYMKINETQQNRHGSFFVGTQLQEMLNPGAKAGILPGQNTLFGASKADKNQEMLAEKKANAQHQAMKLVSDQVANDMKTDESVAKMQDQHKKMSELSSKTGQLLDDTKAAQQIFHEQSGVSEDSEEYKNLELLRKGNDPEYLRTLTREERKELDKQINDLGPMTEYQQEMLSYDFADREFTKLQNNADAAVESISRAMISTKIELLKSDPMLKIQKQADEILKNASEDIIGMLKQQAIDHLDETQEEQEKKLEEQQEKKEEEEEKAGGAQNEQEALQEHMQTDIQKRDLEQEKLEKELKKILDKNNLLAEDLKGIEINETL